MSLFDLLELRFGNRQLFERRTQAVSFEVDQQLALQHADGSEEMILAVDPWDFDWQRVYRLAEPMKFRDGDKLRVSCTFDNSPENPATGGSPADVSWGEGSFDEMCVGNLFITEP